MEQYKHLVRFVLENGTRREDRTGVGTVSVFGTQDRYDLRKGFPLVTLKKTHFSSIVKELLWFLRGETNIDTLGCGIWNEWANSQGELGPIYGKQWRNWEWRDVDGGNNGYGSCDHYCNSKDQIEELIQNLKSDPLSRRHIVSAWNVGDLSAMALQPCHVMFQCYASLIPKNERIRLPGALARIPNNSIGREFRFQDEGLDLPEVREMVLSKIESGGIRLYDKNNDGHWYIHPETPEYYLDLQLYQRSADLMLGVNW